MKPMKWVRCKTTSDYEAIILTPKQAFELVAKFFPNEKINVRRTWPDGYICKPKTKASAKPVGMGTLLADIMRHWQQETPNSKPEDWFFPSFKLPGRKPRPGSIMAQNYLCPAAAKAENFG
jgi:hypothetical protein